MGKLRVPVGVSYKTQHKELEITIHLFSVTCIVVHLKNIEQKRQNRN